MATIDVRKGAERAMDEDIERALRLFGPLEGRIMRAVWDGTLETEFVVRDVHRLMPELAYTTVMTTVSRLADKGLVEQTASPQPRAHVFRSRQSPAAFLAASGAREFSALFDRYGDTAVASFAASLDDLAPAQRARLRELFQNG
jgi:predicted transcriptional regulator